MAATRRSASSKTNEPTVLRSWEDLRARVTDLLGAINADPNLAVAAAANPLYALAELGFEIDADARKTIEDRFRFSYRTAARLRALRRELGVAAGKQFDPDSPSALQSVLLDELRLAPSKRQSGGGHAARERQLGPLPVQARWARAVDDPLEAWRGAHPIVELLLEYRRLEASAPRLASAEVYQQLRRGERKVPIVRLRARLKTERRSTAEGNHA